MAKGVAGVRVQCRNSQYVGAPGRGGAAEKSGEEEGQGRGEGGRDREREGREGRERGPTGAGRGPRCGGLGFLLPCPTGRMPV